MGEDSELVIRKRRLLRDFAIIAASIAVGFWLQSSQLAPWIVELFSSLYFFPAAFLMGFLFSLTFTAAISTSVFILLSETTHNPYLIALIGGLGSITANGIIYRFFNKEILADIELLEPKSAKRIAHRIIHSKLFVSLIPYVAALTLISPLPDEVGLLLLSGTKLKYTRFFLLSFGLHTIGILLIVLIGKSII